MRDLLEFANTILTDMSAILRNKCTNEYTNFADHETGLTTCKDFICPSYLSLSSVFPSAISCAIDSIGGICQFLIILSPYAIVRRTKRQEDGPVTLSEIFGNIRMNSRPERQLGKGYDKREKVRWIKKERAGEKPRPCARDAESSSQISAWSRRESFWLWEKRETGLGGLFPSTLFGIRCGETPKLVVAPRWIVPSTNCDAVSHSWLALKERSPFVGPQMKARRE